jgi:hypothetical protein
MQKETLRPLRQAQGKQAQGKKMQIETVSALMEGGNLFESSGYAYVKVTKAGAAKALKLPVKSTGVDEFMDKLAELAPQPPVITKTVPRDSAEGQALGLATDGPVQMFDLTDAAYMEKLKAHNQDFIWRVVIFALDMEFKTKDGQVVDDFETKKAILKSNGITWAHANQVYADVEKLTRFAEEREDFLSANASGWPVR